MKNKTIIYCLILIILSAFVYHVWFTFSILQHSDWWFFYINKLKELSISSTWFTSSGFGTVDLTFWKLPIYLLYSLFGNMNFNSSVADFFVVFLPIIFLLPLSSFFLIKKITSSNIGGFIGSIVISFNTYFLAISTQGHEMITVASSFCISSFLLFIKGLESTNKRLIYLTLSSLFLVISGFYDLRMTYIIFFVMLTYLLYFLFFLNRFSWSEIIALFKKIFVAFLSFIFLNLYWLLPQIKSASLLGNSVLDRLLFGNNFWNLQSSFTLFHPFWNGSVIEWFVVHPIPFYFWFVPFLAFISFYINRKNKYLVFFAIISLVGIFLTKQADQPFSQFYSWLFTHMPGFNAFREATKFYFLITLGYSVLLGSLATLLLKKYSNKFNFLFKGFLTVVILGLFIWNVKPIINGDIGTMFIPRTIPTDYLVLNNFISSQPEYFRTLWIPSDSRWSVNTNNHPELSVVNVIPTQWKNIFSYNNFINWPKPVQIISPLNYKFSRFISSLSSIKYVIVPVQDKSNDDDFFVYYGGDKDPNIRHWYINQLDKINWLKKLDIGTKDLVIYENKDYKEPIFTFSKLINFDSLQNIEDKYSFNKKIGNEFFFVSGTGIYSTSTLTKIDSLFSNSTENKNIAIDRLNNSLENTKLYVNYDSYNLKNYLTLNGKKVSAGHISIDNKESVFEYNNPKYTLENLIPNGSFESGLWSKKVGDCNNFDKNPILAINLNNMEKTDGVQSLQLEATRHIACTAVGINVKAGSAYQFSFDYQSPNSKQASYYIGFNDKTKTNISEHLVIKDTKWNSFAKTIIVPKGATIVSIYIYADSVDEKTNIINRYDNFKLIQVPDLSDVYYLVSEPDIKLKEPKAITFDLINPTKKLVHIKGATTPFYVAMSESYHDQWQLQFNNNKVSGFFDSWTPFVSPDRIGNEYHYKLNDFLNAWYVDTDKYCAENSFCTKNADGSYDIEMVIEFFPQRWFYLGLLISGTTIVGCLGYLGYQGVKRIRIKLKKKNEKDN